MQPEPIYLKDYSPPPYLIDKVELYFVLEEKSTKVKSKLAVRANPVCLVPGNPFILNGEELEFISASIDSVNLLPEQYCLEKEKLIILNPPESFSLETIVKINPGENNALEGLYLSNKMFCTQCEAEGFRRITWFPDRPDVMSKYTVTINADKDKYPVLLSNGNLIDHGTIDDSRHFIKWEDPFPKPCYLFALVAGDLGKISDIFTTSSGKDIRLEIYTESHNIDKCDHAMSSLKKAMSWDEQVYGLECDLKQYMVVAVDHFNMGAMENKGLNIFNSKLLLASPETATDGSYMGIEAVIAHEYFHNWTGNRVTCRDWFQLSLKEGLTVYRDQEFSADQHSRSVQRIIDVRLLRNHQFPEDGGPMAHPIRPASYIKIDNFYTVTIYEKGAEVIRMMATILGKQGFRKGIDLYFSRHDGQAVTTDDFIRAMADANDLDLAQFSRWYNQAGTPELKIKDHYSNKEKTYRLEITQSCPAVSGQNALPFKMPFTIGLIGKASGKEYPVKLKDELSGSPFTRTLILDKRNDIFEFSDLEEPVIPSLNRNFSSPVKLNYSYSSEDLALLMTHDPDPFNKWDAGQQLAKQEIFRLIDDFQNKKEMVVSDFFLELFENSLDACLDKEHSFYALLLTLPSEQFLAEEMEVIDVEGIFFARKCIRRQIAEKNSEKISHIYSVLDDGQGYTFNARQAGKRSLKNTLLSYLMLLESSDVLELCLDQMKKADNMTDTLAALTALAHSDLKEKENALAKFYEKWKNSTLVIDNWLSIQATSPSGDCLKTVKELYGHSAFSLKNPNKVRALIGAFAKSNPINFHQIDGAGYEFLGEIISRLDSLNPQIASRLSSSFIQWQRYDQTRRRLMKNQLRKLLAKKNLSSNVYEVVSKGLGKNC
jgi:aminopeptidase N